MSFKERFISPLDIPLPPCCDGCDIDKCNPNTCETLNDLIESNDKAIRDLEIKTGWPNIE